MELFRIQDLPVALCYKVGHKKLVCVSRSQFKMQCEMIIATSDLRCVT